MVEGFRREPVPELATQGGRRGIGVPVPVIPEFGRIHKAIFRVGDGRAHVKVQAFEQEIVLFQFVGEQGGPRSSMSLPDLGFYALDFLVGLALAQTPEELYDLYSTPETRAILEKANQIEQESQAAEAAARTKETLALSLAIVIGLIPLGYIGRNIIKDKTWKTNPTGTIGAIGAGIAGGLVLFGLNYGVFPLKIRMGDGFNTALAFLIVLVLRKNPPKPS